MSDAKTEYSNGVTKRKDLAQMDLELAGKIQDGYNRKQEYGSGWDSVNINDVVNEIAPGSTPVYGGGKIIYYNADKSMAVVADVSGYLRVEDLSQGTKHRRYLDRHGKDAYNYIDERGKKRGRSKKEFRRVTHYIIKKREEM